jgi:hypothetical protein
MALCESEWSCVEAARYEPSKGGLDGSELRRGFGVDLELGVLARLRGGLLDRLWRYLPGSNLLPPISIFR